MIHLEIKQILTQILAFLLLLWILKKFVWAPLIDILNERKEHIKNIYDKAWETKANAEELKKQYENQLQQIHIESQKIIQKATKEAKEIAFDIEEKSQLKAKEILENAHRQSERDLKKAKIELKKEIIDMTFLALEKIIHLKLKPHDRDQFAFDLLEKL